MEEDREDRIRDRAYLIWLDEGSPHGRAEEHWRKAAEALDTEEAAVAPLQNLPRRFRADRSAQSLGRLPIFGRRALSRQAHDKPPASHHDQPGEEAGE